MLLAIIKLKKLLGFSQNKDVLWNIFIKLNKNIYLLNSAGLEIKMKNFHKIHKIFLKNKLN